MTPEIETLQKKLAANPQSLVFVALADALRRSGDLDEAVRICRDGLAAHPAYMSAHVVLGRTYFEKRDFAAALDEFRKVLESDPDNLVGHSMRGQILAARGDHAAAIPEFEAALALHADDESLRAMLDASRAAARRGASVVGLDEILSDAPPPPAAARRVTDVWDPATGTARAAEPGAAPEETVVAPPPAAGPVLPAPPGEAGREARDELATLTVAEIYLKQGFVQEAIEIFQKILAVDPGNREAKARLDAAFHSQEFGAAPEVAALQADREPEFTATDVLSVFRDFNGGPPAGQAQARGAETPVLDAVAAPSEPPAASVATPPDPVAGLEPPTRSAPPSEPGPAQDTHGSQLSLADLYVSQGYVDEAIEVLQQALALSPDRSDIQKKLHDLYRGKEGREQNPLIRQGSAPVSAFRVEDEILSASETAIDEIGDSEPEPDRGAPERGTPAAAKTISSPVVPEASSEAENRRPAHAAPARMEPLAPDQAGTSESTALVETAERVPFDLRDTEPIEPAVVDDAPVEREAPSAPAVAAAPVAEPVASAPAASAVASRLEPPDSEGVREILRAFVESNGVTASVVADREGAVVASVAPAGTDVPELARAAAAIFLATERVTGRLQHGRLVRVSLTAPGQQIFLAAAALGVLVVAAGDGVKIGFLRLAMADAISKLNAMHPDAE